MGSVWPDVCCASLPRQALAALAGLRHVADVRVIVAGACAWVYWEVGNEDVLARVLPLAGAKLYTRREGTWYRHGGHLPAFEVPSQEEALPLHAVIFPEVVRPEYPTREAIRPQVLRLERDERPRQTSAMRCPLTELARWADTAATAQLSGFRAARSSSSVMLLGADVPLLPGAERFWGERLLVPLGFRPWPGLPEEVLLEALGVQDGELLVLNVEGGEVIPLDAFRPLTRAGVRLAQRVPS